MAIQSSSMYTWSLSREDNGHRTYSVRLKVVADVNEEAPTLLAAAPAIGTPFTNDVWALSTPKLKVTPTLEGEPHRIFWMDLEYSTRPHKRCQDESIEDPLMEPAKISGTYVKFSKEATVDRNGKAIKSSSHEMFRGAAVEFDDNRPSVRIQFNHPENLLGTFAPLIDCVNDSPLWGLSERKIKLGNAPWERNVYGLCNFYYTTTLEFEVNYEGWDRRIVDEGTKILAPGGNLNDPRDFIVYKDVNGENTRVMLDGLGAPLDDALVPFVHVFEKYNQTNFLALGIPSSL